MTAPVLWCPDQSHDPSREVEDAQITLRAPFMSQLLPRMRALEEAGWRLNSMTKPMWESGGDGDLVRAIFVRGEAVR